MSEQYPNLNQLRIPVKEHAGVPYVLWHDIDFVLSVPDRRHFREVFVCDDAPVVPQGLAVWPKDAERALKFLLEGK